MDTTMLKEVVEIGSSVMVTVKKTLEPRDSEFGSSMLAFVEMNGEEYGVYFKEKDFDKVKEGL